MAASWIFTGVAVFFVSLGFGPVVIGLLLLLTHWLRRDTWKFLKNFPGPSERIPLLQNISQYRTFKKMEHLIEYNVQAFNEACGGLLINRKDGLFRFYIGSHAVVAIFSAEFVESLLTSSTLIDKSFEYKLLHPWLGTGLLTSTGSKWKGRRRLLTPAFHFRILEDFIPMMNEQAKILADRLDNETVKDIVPLVTSCTLDIICETVMGVSVGAQKNSSSLYVQSINRLGEAFSRRISSPILFPDVVFYRTSMGKTFKESLKVLHNFTRQVIHDRKEELLKDSLLCSNLQDDNTDVDIRRKNKKPFLDLLLTNHLQNGGITEEEIREEVDTFMFEGHDTTAMGISWAFYLIGLHPDIQKKLHDELDEVFQGDMDRDVTPEDLKELKYMECVLKECQRLFPSVPFIGREITETTKIGKYTIPKGTTISTFIYGLHRDTKYFPKPEEFIPDRFLPENTVGRHPFAYVPFSAGSRNCIGQKFAMMEEKIVVSTVLRKLHLKSIDPRDKLKITFEMVLRPKNGLRMKMTRRS